MNEVLLCRAAHPREEDPSVWSKGYGWREGRIEVKASGKGREVVAPLWSVGHLLSFPWRAAAGTRLVAAETAESWQKWGRAELSSARVG